MGALIFLRRGIGFDRFYFAMPMRHGNQETLALQYTKTIPALWGAMF